MQCTVEGCERQAAVNRHGKLDRDGMCWACSKAKQRNGTTHRESPQRGVRHPTRKDMVREACNAMADVDPMDNGAWDRAWARLWQAVRRYRQKANTVPKGPDTTSRG